MSPDERRDLIKRLAAPSRRWSRLAVADAHPGAGRGSGWPAPCC